MPSLIILDGRTLDGAFATDTPVSLDPGEGVGHYHDGEVIPTKGKFIEAIFKDISTKTKQPVYVVFAHSLSQSQNTDGEVGESVANVLVLNGSSGDAGSVTSTKILKDGVQVSTAGSGFPFSRNSNVVRSLTPIVYQAKSSYNAGAPKNVTGPNGSTVDTRPAQVRNPNAPQAAESDFPSNTVSIVGHLAVFFGPFADPLVPRQLEGKMLTSQGNGNTLNTGVSAKKFAIVAPPGFKLLRVIDEVNASTDITGAYIPQPQVSVPDAAGVAVPGYTPYILSQAVPYSVSARHVFIFGNA